MKLVKNIYNFLVHWAEIIYAYRSSRGNKYE